MRDAEPEFDPDALERGGADARAASLRGAITSAAAAPILAAFLEVRPGWWDDRAGDEVLGDLALRAASRHLARTHGPALLAAARGRRVEDEILRDVLAWSPDGPALDALLDRLAAGLVWPAADWERILGRYVHRGRRGAELVRALAATHGDDVRAVVERVLPALARTP